LFEETNELRAGVPLSGPCPAPFPFSRPMPHTEITCRCGDTHNCAVPIGRATREARIEAVQRLDRSFLIHAKHGCVLWRGQVQADCVSRFGLEIRIVTRHSVPAMRAYVGLRQNSLNSAFADVKVARQFSARLMRGTVFGPFLNYYENLGLQFPVRTGDFWPRCHSSINPAIRCFQNRSFQCAVVAAVVSNKS
jgi:hypothetical protein